MEKIKEASERDTHNAIEKMKRKWEKEIATLRGKLKVEHEIKKREKLENISGRYLKHSVESKRLLDFQETINEEMNLVERFESFAKRIHFLEKELRETRDSIPKKCKECGHRIAPSK